MCHYKNEFYFVLIPDTIAIKIKFLEISQKFLSQICKKFRCFVKNQWKHKNFVELNLSTQQKLSFKNKNFLTIFLREDVKLCFDENKKIFYGEIKKNIFSFETLLRVLASLVILRNNGVILHSSNVIEKNGSVLYVGPSGSGKSTIAKKYSKEKILTDELSILIIRNNKLLTFKSPFWGELGEYIKDCNIDKKFKVEKIMFLSGFVKNNQLQIQISSIKEKLNLFLKNIFWVIQDSSYSKKILDLVLKISRKISCYKFYPIYEIQN